MSNIEERQRRTVPTAYGLNDVDPGETTGSRQRRGEEIARMLGADRPHPTLGRIQEEFPFLAGALTGYALGDVFGRTVLDARTRQLAIVAAFAALGLTDFVKLHGRYALNAGVAADELKEIVYLTTIPAGFPRAIQAALALSELFLEAQAGQDGHGGGQPGEPAIP